MSKNNGSKAAALKTPVGKINPVLKPYIVGIDSLRLDPKNSRVHGERNLEAIKNSLNQFGQQTPIVVTDKNIIHKGNGTFEAAKELGWTHIAAVITDLKNKKDLTGYKVADNKTGDLASWDYEILSRDIKAFPELDWQGLGWEEWELQPLMNAVWTKPQTNDDESGSGLLSIKMTEDQKKIFDEAAAICRAKAEDENMTDGRCLELICAEFLSGSH